MAWDRRRYRKHKVWILLNEEGDPELDDRGLAAMRYRPDDERTYTVKPDEIRPVDDPQALAPQPEPPSQEGVPEPDPGPVESIEVWTDGASSGNPGPAGLGVVLRWGDREREISRSLGETTNNVAELTAVLEALRAIRRPELPVRVHTDSAYVIGLLRDRHKPRANTELVERIRKETRRFVDLKFIKVRAHAGTALNERADALARKACGRPRPD